ncbi:MAG TPA: glycosyltransferase [Anaerolineales bacterium]|nr:glycosyltransferase [Anaerolineales bacterium]
MRVLISLMYYRPHYSGLTIYAERLARALAARGHQVTVLTSRFDPRLPGEEVKDGVHIVRARVLMRLSKGVIMPGMPFLAWKLIRQAEVINPHVPQPDAAYISKLARLLGKPVVLTYQCDLVMPKGFIHALANLYAHFTNHISAALAEVIVTTTRDFAEQSPFLRRYLGKVRAIQPPIQLASIGPSDLEAFRARFSVKPGQRIIGIAARLATEKGVEYLVQALSQVLVRHPNARVLFAGQYTGVLGEEQYAQKLAPLIEGLGEHWSFLGILTPEELAAFFHISEVTVLPSINSTEAFGMVQVESMACGTPVVATDLPGVRQPVLITGMGMIVPPADPQALAEALIAVLDNPSDFFRDAQEIRRRFSPENVATEYEALFEELLKHR